MGEAESDQALPVQGRIRLLLDLAAPHRRALLVGLVLSLLATTCGLLLPLAAREVIERVGTDASVSRPVLLLLALVAGAALFEAARSYLLDRTGERIVADARRRIVGRLLRLPIPELDARPSGELVSRVTSDTTLLRSATSNGLVELVSGSIGVVLGLVFMGYVDLVLLGVSTGVLVVVGFVVAVFAPLISRATERAQAAVGDIGAGLERALGAMRLVKSSRAEDREEAGLQHDVERAYREGRSIAVQTAGLGVATSLGLQLTFLAVLGVGGARVANDDMTVGSLVAFLLYIFQLAGPIALLTMAVTAIAPGAAAAMRIAEVEAIPVEQTAPDSSSPTPPTLPAQIAFEDVTFGYVPGREVLRDVSLSARRGEMVAIVGPSGSGKSTLLQLALGFYRPWSGRVTLDGTDIAAVPLSQLRAHVGYVEQDTPAVAGTLRANLAYSAPDADDETLLRAASAAHLDGLLARIPDGLDGDVLSRGVSLSGGERQRLAIARALVRPPAILLLDEPTASLDALSEQALQATLRTLRERSAVIVVAHRLATVRDADRIVVLADGVVRATGTHDELLRSDTLYGELARLQFTAAEEIPEAMLDAPR